jgi:hypothetical protein
VVWGSEAEKQRPLAKGIFKNGHVEHRPAKEGLGGHIVRGFPCQEPGNWCTHLAPPHLHWMMTPS